MANFENFEIEESGSKQNIKKEKLSDDLTVETYINSQTKKAEEFAVKNKEGDIIEFAELKKNKQMFAIIRDEHIKYGIKLTDEEIEKIYNKFLDVFFKEVIFGNKLKEGKS